MVTFIDHDKIILWGDKDERLETHRFLKCKKAQLEQIDEEDIVPLYVNHPKEE